jgi:hypothetical protein
LRAGPAQRALLEFPARWFNRPRQNYKEGLYASNVGMTRRHPLAAALDTQRQHGQRVVAAAAAAANAKM